MSESRKLLAGLMGASALFASLPAATQVSPATSLLPNGAVNNRSHQYGYDYYRNAWGYNFYFGSKDQGKYGDGEWHAWNVQGNVWLIAGEPDQNNVVVQIGNDGVLVVDTGTAEMAPKLLAVIKKIAAQYAGDHDDIRWVVNTSSAPDHVGGNKVIREGGKQIIGISLGASDRAGATVISSQHALSQLIQSGAAEDLIPSEAHEDRIYSWYFNDEAVTLHQPRSANTNGNLLVQFRRADVIAVGDLVNHSGYPYIDVKNGGTIDGLLTSLHDLRDLMAPGYHNGPIEGGTMVVPGHGRLMDRAELLYYTYMVQTLRNRIMYYKNRGKSLQDVLAMKITWDFDGRWGGKNSRGWTPQDFVKAVYETLPAGSSKGPDRFFIPGDN